jgi:hypothetical protein
MDIVTDNFSGYGKVTMEGYLRIEEAINSKPSGLEIDSEVSG